MGTLDVMRERGFKKVVFCNDEASGLRAIIAIHSTVLGPGSGGVRIWPYADEETALRDVLRLARGMTYKTAAAGLELGGAKSVIIADPARDKTEMLLRAMGRMVEQLGGDYLAGFDMGTTLEDMEVLNLETEHVITLPEHAGGAGDVSAATALGVVQAIRACANRVWGTPDLTGRTVAVQGLGAVGGKVVSQLVELGARPVVTDVNADRVDAAVRAHGVESVAADEILGLDVDVFSPNAMGGVIGDAALGVLRAKVVAGGANNVLVEERHGEELERRGIAYAVDFVANSGGIVYDYDRLRAGGLDADRATASVARIYDRVGELFAISDRDGISCHQAAERIAEDRIEAVGRLRLIDRPR